MNFSQWWEISHHFSFFNYFLSCYSPLEFTLENEFKSVSGYFYRYKQPFKFNSSHFPLKLLPFPSSSFQFVSLKIVFILLLLFNGRPKKENVKSSNSFFWIKTDFFLLPTDSNRSSNSFYKIKSKNFFLAISQNSRKKKFFD